MKTFRKLTASVIILLLWGIGNTQVLEVGIGSSYNSYALNYTETLSNNSAQFIKSYYGKIDLGYIYYRFDYTNRHFSSYTNDDRTYTYLKFESKRIGLNLLKGNEINFSYGYSLLSLNHTNKITVQNTNLTYTITYDKFNLPGYFFDFEFGGIGCSYDKWYNQDNPSKFIIYSYGNLIERLNLKTEVGIYQDRYMSNVFLNFMFYLSF